MRDDSISRAAAIDHWRAIIDATDEDSIYNMGFVDGLEFCINHLSTIPSAQSEVTEDEVKEYCRKRCLSIIDSALLKKYASVQPERKRGEWMQISPAGIYECSECAQMVMTKDISCYKYCHGCGAYMKGGNEYEEE